MCFLDFSYGKVIPPKNAVSTSLFVSAQEILLKQLAELRPWRKLEQFPFLWAWETHFSWKARLITLVAAWHPVDCVFRILVSHIYDEPCQNVRPDTFFKLWLSSILRCCCSFLHINLRWAAPLPVKENKGCKALAYFIVFFSLFSLKLLQQLLNWSLVHQPPPSPEHLNCQSSLDMDRPLHRWWNICSPNSKSCKYLLLWRPHHHRVKFKQIRGAQVFCYMPHLSPQPPSFQPCLLQKHGILIVVLVHCIPLSVTKVSPKLGH